MLKETKHLKENEFYNKLILRGSFNIHFENNSFKSNSLITSVYFQDFETNLKVNDHYNFLRMNLFGGEKEKMIQFAKKGEKFWREMKKEKEKSNIFSKKKNIKKERKIEINILDSPYESFKEKFPILLCEKSKDLDSSFFPNIIIPNFLFLGLENNFFFFYCYEKVSRWCR